jgi:peptidoglycan hydrolase-like protein with peptidoglycan-binding domain
MQVLRIGSRGPDVRRVQQALNRCMLPPKNSFTSPPLKRLIEDESFGTKTQAMVREFQRLNQADPDGVVGPITSYLLLPFISFTAQFAGKGRIRGRRGGLDQVGGRLPAARVSFTGPSRVGAAKAKETVAGNDTEDEGITVDVSVGSGNGNSFKPWFVLKPNNDSQAPEAEGTIGVDSTVLRLKGFEFGGGLEFSRPLIAPAGDTWQWAGTISGSYTNLKTKDGTLSLSPIVDLSVKQGLLLGAGVGAEASIQLIEDLLQLSVGGKVAAEVDPHDGSLQVGPAVSVGLKFKWEVVRFGKK